MQTDLTETDPAKLRELASWYRDFAERAGDPTIWEARLRTAKELEAEADLVERTRETQHRSYRWCPMKTGSGKESRYPGLLHQLSERLTAARNEIEAAQRRPEIRSHGISRPPTELLDRALKQLDQANEIVVHLQNAVDGSPPAEAGMDRCYRVCFMNRLARGRNTITACQRSIVVPSAESREAAIEVAKQRFAELEGIPNWQIHASFIEAALLEEDVAAARREADEQRSADDYSNLLAHD